MGVDQTKLRLYRRGADSLHRLDPSLPRAYACPICTTGYDRKGLASGELTKEHVPPKSVGGRVLCLTCKTCNNRAGSALEHHLEKRESAADLGRALGGEESVDAHPAVMRIGDVEQRVELTGGAGSGLIVEGLPDLNPPGVGERLSELLSEIVESGEWGDKKLNLASLERFDPWRVQVALLKAGFLAAFAMLGYSYALHPALDVVREQIQRPDEELLPPFGGWVPEGEEALELWHVREPLGALLVQIGREWVLLPDVGAEEGIYDRVLADREGLLEEANGRQLKWPTTMHMALDEQVTGKGSASEESG